jgi:hypothetical protein
MRMYTRTHCSTNIHTHTSAYMHTFPHVAKKKSHKQSMVQRHTHTSSSHAHNRTHINTRTRIPISQAGIRILIHHNLPLMLDNPRNHVSHHTVTHERTIILHAHAPFRFACAGRELDRAGYRMATPFCVHWAYGCRNGYDLCEARARALVAVPDDLFYGEI